MKTVCSFFWLTLYVHVWYHCRLSLSCCDWQVSFGPPLRYYVTLYLQGTDHRKPTFTASRSWCTTFCIDCRHFTPTATLLPCLEVTQLPVIISRVIAKTTTNVLWTRNWLGAAARRWEDVVYAFTRRQHFSAWNDVMAAVLKVWTSVRKSDSNTTTIFLQL